MGLLVALPVPGHATWHLCRRVVTSITYRTTYADFLRSDFPRVPFAEANEDFVALAGLGSALIDAHLLRNVPKRGLGDYTGKGSCCRSPGSRMSRMC